MDFGTEYLFSFLATTVLNDQSSRLTGRKWTDLVNNITISSLGYAPQLFGSGDFKNVSVIYDLIAKSGGKALIVDPSHLHMVPDPAASPVPQFPPVEDADMVQAIAKLTSAGQEDALTFDLESVVPVGRDDLAVLFHSSGTTGGMPKILPNTYKMLHSVLQYKLDHLFPAGAEPATDSRQIVINTIGSTAHIASFHSAHLVQCRGDLSVLTFLKFVIGVSSLPCAVARRRVHGPELVHGYRR